MKYIAAIAMIVVAKPPFAASPAVFAVDSTNTLYAFDYEGNSIAQAATSGNISKLNGGGIAVAAGKVYVTLGQPGNNVAVFDAVTLSPANIKGSFVGLNVPRGIASDTFDKSLYIGNGGPVRNIDKDTEFSRQGRNRNAPGGWPGNYGPSGVAYDSVDNTIWIANFFGAQWSGVPEYGVTEYNGDGSAAQTFNYATQFVPPSDPETEQPYSIAYCAKAEKLPVSLVVVGFIAVPHVRKKGEVQTYSTSGAAASRSFPGIHDPNGLSCSASGLVYVADDSGLLVYTAYGRRRANQAGKFTGMTPPIYGVWAR